IALPKALVKSRQPITLTLRLPDAARPALIAGEDDHRILGFALCRVMLLRDDTAQLAARRLEQSASDPERPVANDQSREPVEPMNGGDVQISEVDSPRDRGIAARLAKTLRDAFELP